MAFSSMVQGLLAKLKAKQGGELAGIGKYGPQYNPGPTRQFTPGPMPDVPFMPPAQVGPQTINLGLAGTKYDQSAPNFDPMAYADRHIRNVTGAAPTEAELRRFAGMFNPHNLPGAAGSAVPGQSATYNQPTGTSAGAAGMKPAGGMNMAAAQAGLAMLQRAQAEPMQWIQMPQTRWGGQ
jgi:hypothetical protein